MPPPGIHAGPVSEEARFGVGEIIVHALFGYRGVVADVDPEFRLSDEWYEQVARSRPPRDEPWYQVLPDGASHTTYVAQRNLARDPSGEPVRHPLLSSLFGELRDGRYAPLLRPN